VFFLRQQFWIMEFEMKLHSVVLKSALGLWIALAANTAKAEWDTGFYGGYGGGYGGAYETGGFTSVDFITDYTQIMDYTIATNPYPNYGGCSTSLIGVCDGAYGGAGLYGNDWGYGGMGQGGCCNLGMNYAMPYGGGMYPYGSGLNLGPISGNLGMGWLGGNNMGGFSAGCSIGYCNGGGYPYPYNPSPCGSSYGGWGGGYGYGNGGGMWGGGTGGCGMNPMPYPYNPISVNPGYPWSPMPTYPTVPNYPSYPPYSYPTNPGYPPSGPITIQPYPLPTMPPLFPPTWGGCPTDLCGFGPNTRPPIPPSSPTIPMPWPNPTVPPITPIPPITPVTPNPIPPTVPVAPVHNYTVSPVGVPSDISTIPRTGFVR
jgi:hypothetical protein